MREKCKNTGYHPSEEDCKKCLSRQVKTSELKNSEICLLRLFGIPIQEGFDGIHHGHEGADITYIDSINGSNITIGIHVKSKASDKFKKGLGRSASKIKELYAQTFFTMYEISKAGAKYNVLGIGMFFCVTGAFNIKPLIFKPFHDMSNYFILIWC